ncbi:MAG: tetratricopeptide repeat protein [Anaerolineaceae bacterium]|nr:tetratricopeptide repeat protein [Anaerolineaceae bacterium]MDD4043672.1 tetratricopeptide repeat protein [Anaerolineaceae bacterium]MDD4578792.1 tetratricopeptide repeat protein [Anaerolineaceae bacterium]
MMPINIIDVNEETFEIEVVNYSIQMPVVVDFWAPWCIPCRIQSQTLAQLAQEADGEFRLARVNVDEQTRLAEHLKVTNLPAIKAFVDGRIVAEYVGVLSEKNLRMFVDRIMPRAGSLLLVKGNSLMLLGDFEEAEETLEQYVIQSHGDPAGLLAYARALLYLGNGKAALQILEQFPVSSEMNDSTVLLPVAKAYNDPEMEKIVLDNPLESAFRNAIRLAKRGKILIALDGLLGVLKKDKNYRNGQAKAVYLGLLEVLSDDHPATRQYRSDLSTALF